MRPLDSRLSVERDCMAKYSVSARARTCGLSAAMRAMPTRPALGLAEGGPNPAGEIEMSAVAIGSLPLPCQLWSGKNYFRFLFAFCQERFLQKRCTVELSIGKGK